MSVTSEITRLQNAKADLKTAIEGKGVTVSSSTKLDGYAALVDSISGGGSDDDNWYILLMTSDITDNIFRMYPSVNRVNDRWFFRGHIEGHELNGYVRFKYKNETYYIDSFTNGNHTLSKQGVSVSNTIDLMRLEIFKEGDLFKVNIQED